MNNQFVGAIVTTLLYMFIASCNSQSGDTLFQNLSPNKTNITFENKLTESNTFNYFLFPYIYMGAGVSAGDFNNDGLTDLYFTGNMVSNRLYINKGNLTFKDATETSNTGGDNRWMLGTTVCDINNDGLLDIYISVSGFKTNTENLLFVNQGNNNEGVPIFKEEAKKYGINDAGLSTQGTFFDYDNDGDLDLYVANYPVTNFKAPAYLYKQMMRNAKLEESSHLYRNNNNGTFTDVTKESGLLTFGLSLSATICDLNKDGFKDIYVSNDFLSPDFFFFNNGDGTFSDRTKDVVQQTSHYGMGADVADYNNDGYLDIIQIDMAPEDNKRAKENMSSANPEDFAAMVDEGLHHQYKFSTLYLNRGIIKKKLPFFSNAGWIAEVTQTDWSWAGLFADFDLDGWKDLYVTNGSRRDMNNADYFDEINKTGELKKQKPNYVKLVEMMPAKQMLNYMFKNNGNLTFTHINEDWNLTQPSFSNGVAYADLDNDGDLEIIVNNIDQEAHIYKNNAYELKKGNYLKVKFEGGTLNKMGIGSSVTIWHNNNKQFSELTLSRGYESSMEPILYFGLSKDSIIDSLEVKWPNGNTQILKNIQSNQMVTLKYINASLEQKTDNKTNTLFSEITDSVKFQYIHKENIFDGRKYQVLLPHQMSTLGPKISKGDINGDKLEDFFIGNSVRNKGQMFVQTNDGNFVKQDGPWEKDSLYEDAGSCLFDADNDGDLDLFVVTGGDAFPENSEQYSDRLYVNEGGGKFSEGVNIIPQIKTSGSCVTPIDFDNDGDLDLFVGGGHIPKKYPYSPKSYILENQSSKENPKFVDATTKIAGELQNIGMVTSALSIDIDGDKWQDLIIAGEWMPVCILKNNKGKFVKSEVDGTKGWWFSLNSADFDNDGDIDIIGGNLGLNFRYQANPENTFDVYANDFEKDGKYDIVLSYYQTGKQYPLRGRDCYVKQNPGLEAIFPTYEEFGEATVSEIYSESALQKSLHLKAENFASCYFENIGNNQFKIHKLPNEAQLSSINEIVIEDFNNDGSLDILAAGNMHNIEIVTPRNDAGIGVLLIGNGKGEFNPVHARKSGFFAPDNVKSLKLLKLKQNRKIILVGNNDSKLQVFKINQLLK